MTVFLAAVLSVWLSAGCGDDDTSTKPDPTTGRVQIDPLPNSVHASWILSSLDGYSRGGAGSETVSELSPGVYSVTWSEVNGWVAPPAITRNLAAGETAKFAGTYVQKIGTIAVDQTPDVLTDAAWTLRGPRNVYASGDRILGDMPGGTYTLTWTEVSGRVTPPTDTQILTLGDTLTFGGTYIQRVELPSAAFTIAIDSARGQIYASLTKMNAVAVVSTADLAVIDHIVVGSLPLGLALALDGRTLYCALNGAGAVAALDLATRQTKEIDVGTKLRDPRTYDVIEAQPNILLVTANPGGNGFASVVKVDRGNGDAVRYAAGNRTIRSQPTLARDLNGAVAYVGEGFMPNSLFKLDMSVDSCPIILEDVHDSVRGTDRIAVSPDGQRLYLRSGQVLRAASFNQAGIIGAGVPELSLDGSVCYVGSGLAIETYDTRTFLKTGSIAVPEVADRLVLSQDGSTMYMLSGDVIYAIPLP